MEKGQGTFLGATRNAYRRRWFALRHNELMYFKYQKSEQGFGTGTHDTAGRAGVIDMAQVSVKFALMMVVQIIQLL